MSIEENLRKVDILLVEMERAYRDVLKFHDSKVKLPAKELNLLTAFGQLRDQMWATMKDSDRDKLNDYFGGDCARVARVKAVLDKVVFSAMNCDDQRLKGCLNACESVEKVLIDLGSYDKLKEAETAARLKLEAEAAPPEGASTNEDDASKVPDWAADGVQVAEGGKLCVLVAPAAPGEPWRRQRQDGREYPITDWTDISRPAPWTAPPTFADVGKVVVREGRKGKIVSKDPWKITWEDGMSEWVVQWAGIEEAPPGFAADGTPVLMGGRRGTLIAPVPAGAPWKFRPEDDGPPVDITDWADIVEGPRVPGWAADGTPVTRGGRRGVLIIGAGGVPMIRWEDGTTEAVWDWADVVQVSPESKPGWAAGGVIVVRAGRRGVITSGDPRMIRWEDATTDELITDWAGIEQVPAPPPASEDPRGRSDTAASTNPSMDELASPDEAPPIGAVVEDDWAELMGISMCKIGCGRRCAPGVTKFGKTFDTCCRDCAMGRGHHKMCGHIDASKVGVGMCKMGCGRKNNPGKDSLGMPRDTCCRACAIGKGHDDQCQKDDGTGGGARQAVVTMNEHAFFAEVKSNMTLVDFNRLMEQCRFLNRGTQTLDETLKEVKPLFGTKQCHLYTALERLLKERMMTLDAEKAAGRKRPARGGGGYH